MPHDLSELPEDDSDLASLAPDEAETMRKLRSGERSARKHERHLAGLAHEHVKAEHLDDALTAYASHVRAGNVPAKGEEDAHASAFFARHAAEHPEHARPAPPPLSTHDLKKKTGARW